MEWVSKHAFTIRMTAEMAEDVRATAEMWRAIEAAWAEDARLTREIGPMHGPGRRELRPIQRGERLLADLAGRPAGRLHRSTRARAVDDRDG